MATEQVVRIWTFKSWEENYIYPFLLSVKILHLLVNFSLKDETLYIIITQPFTKNEVDRVSMSQFLCMLLISWE